MDCINVRDSKAIQYICISEGTVNTAEERLIQWETTIKFNDLKSNMGVTKMIISGTSVEEVCARCVTEEQV